MASNLTIVDVRDQMPNYEVYRDWQRPGAILGIAVHHSATADRETGMPTGDALTFFNYHVHGRGWAHGGYNYVIGADGLIEYALDEEIAAYHAGFKDPGDSYGLEHGQYWNNHYLAVCLAGWFSNGRSWRDEEGVIHPIPDQHVSPSPAQMKSVLGLLRHLTAKYNITPENVRGHRELGGSHTQCPGLNLDPATLRARLREPEPIELEEGIELPEPGPGEHVVILPSQDYLDPALGYIWRFGPDVTFAARAAVGRWPYVTVVGPPSGISQEQIVALRGGGARLVQRVAGDDPISTQAILDRLVAQGKRFMALVDDSPPEPELDTYTVQPGDTLSSVARQIYGQATLWPIIFNANRDILSDPGRIKPGQVLRIPTLPG